MVKSKENGLNLNSKAMGFQNMNAAFTVNEGNGPTGLSQLPNTLEMPQPFPG